MKPVSRLRRCAQKAIEASAFGSRHYLQRRERILQELVEKLENVADESEIKDAIAKLEFQSLIIKSDDVYRNNIKKALG